MKEKRFVALSFVLLPILDIYGIGVSGFSLGKILMILIIIYTVIVKKSVSLFYYNIWYKIFVFCLCFIPLLLNFNASWFSVSSYFYKFLGLCWFFLVFGFCVKCLDWKYVFRYYKKVTYICIAYFILQEIAFFFYEL